MRAFKPLKTRWRKRQARRDDFDPEGVEERLEESADVLDVRTEAEER